MTGPGEIAMSKTNAKAANCETCGAELKPGEGRLEFVPDAHDNDDFDRVGTDREHSHWEAFCLNTAACKDRAEATAARHAAEQAESKRVKAEAAAVKAAEKKAKQEAWAVLTAGLERTGARPAEYVRTGELSDSGLDVKCEKIALPGDLTGWHVSWIGDLDGEYWLLPATAKRDAEAEKQRMRRVYQWWDPKDYGPDSYPGPGVPEDQLTQDEKAEVARCWAARYAAVEANWVRLVPIAIKPGANTSGCKAWELLTSVGAEVSIVTDPDAFLSFCRAYADRGERPGSLKLIVTLRAKIPASARNKDGSIKAVVERKLAKGWTCETKDRYVEVRAEYV